MLEHLTPKRYALPSGIELHVVEGGPTDGAPLIFVHGAMGDWRSWEAQWTAFTARYRCYSYSRRYSYPNNNLQPSPDHGALHEADDLMQLMDALALPSAILVGSSYGGFTALALAVRAPARVRALVSVEAPMMKYAYRTESGAAVAAAFREQTIVPANAAFRAGDDAEGARIMTGGINGAVMPPADSPAMVRRMQNFRAMRMLALSSDEFPLLADQDLAALAMPILLMSGENTAPVHRAIFDNVCAAMPQAKALRIAGAGHGVSREQPEAFNAAVLEFLDARPTSR
jgi:pimeloyl-ACP methyl ester carboxylesterase